MQWGSKATWVGSLVALSLVLRFLCICVWMSRSIYLMTGSLVRRWYLSAMSDQTTSGRGCPVVKVLTTSGVDYQTAVFPAKQDVAGEE